MLKQIKNKANDEKVQRAVLSGVGFVATYVASRLFATYLSKGIELGIDSLMTKLHPVVEETPEVK